MRMPGRRESAGCGGDTRAQEGALNNPSRPARRVGQHISEGEGNLRPSSLLSGFCAPHPSLVTGEVRSSGVACCARPREGDLPTSRELRAPPGDASQLRDTILREGGRIERFGCGAARGGMETPEEAGRGARRRRVRGRPSFPSPLPGPRALGPAGTPHRSLPDACPDARPGAPPAQVTFARGPREDTEDGHPTGARRAQPSTAFELLDNSSEPLTAQGIGHLARFLGDDYGPSINKLRRYLSGARPERLADPDTVWRALGAPGAAPGAAPAPGGTASEGSGSPAGGAGRGAGGRKRRRSGGERGDAAVSSLPASQEAGGAASPGPEAPSGRGQQRRRSGPA